MKKFNEKSNATGQIIHAYRLKRNMKVTHLCRKLELLGVYINRKDIYNMEKGIMIIKDFEFLAISKILEIPIEHIVNEIFSDL